MTEEKIPPLPKLLVSKFSKQYIDQETLDRAMQIIYERRPDFFRRSYERDKSWEADPTQDEEAWVHDEFTMDLHNFIRGVVLKEIGVTNPMKLNTIQSCVYGHVQSTARKMYGMPLCGETR
jgi:hypothetical protein